MKKSEIANKVLTIAQTIGFEIEKEELSEFTTEFRPIDSYGFFDSISENLKKIGYTECVYLPIEDNFVFIVKDCCDKEIVLTCSNTYIRPFFEDMIYLFATQNNCDNEDYIYEHLFCDGNIRDYLFDAECDEDFCDSTLSMYWDDFLEYYEYLKNILTK